FLRFKDGQMVPVTLERAVGNKTCEESREEEGFACDSENSECHNSTDGLEYRCKCAPCNQGNPYIQGGCEGKMTLRVFHL
ncbi:putative Wall-associated receptor kinase 2, partial [Cocos nucifera]|nr:putative Wall-associated receptor kinase 2 [Cocos nucifera]